MRKIYLIDGDNVSIKDLAREIQTMPCSDEETELIIFYNPNSCEKISLKDVADITGNGKNRLRMVETYNGWSNALDFQLSSYLGMIIQQNITSDKITETEFIIITHDKAFQSLTKFWHDNGVKVTVQQNIYTLALDEDDDEWDLNLDSDMDLNAEQSTSFIDMDDIGDNHICADEKELSRLKLISSTNKMADALQIVKNVSARDREYIKSNKSKLKTISPLSCGESYDVISYIIYFSPSSAALKRYLNEWLRESKKRKINDIIGRFSELNNKDMSRFEF